MLRVSDVHKSYGSVRALAGVDLEVGPGEVVALLGPNGAGKTTLVSLIAGLRKPDAGEIFVGGFSVVASPQLARRQLGLAPQEIGIYPTVSVRDNLRFFGELAGLSSRRLRDRTAEVAELFSLAELLDRKAQTLSGGEARRLHTAMIVLHSPPLLLLDEPTAGVDVQTRNQLLQLVRSLADEGSAVLYSTHYLHEVEQLEASGVAFLVRGQIAAAGSVQELIRTLGGASVELRFDGAAPKLDLDGAIPVGADTLRIPTASSPAETAATLLQRLDGASRNLKEIKLVQPSLESVFLAITSDASAVPETIGRV